MNSEAAIRQIGHVPVFSDLGGAFDFLRLKVMLVAAVAGFVPDVIDDDIPIAVFCEVGLHEPVCAFGVPDVDGMAALHGLIEKGFGVGREVFS